MSGRGNRARWGLLLALPGVLGPLGILGFIFYSETAHDEGRCPYELVLERPVGERGARIREERRRCLTGVEERRFSLVRADRTQVLGRRRFAPDAFTGSGYGWDAGVSDAGEIQMRVHNPGYPPVAFREGTAEERE